MDGTISPVTSFLIALAVGVIVALVGYFLNINTLRKERIESEKARLINAARSILVELEANVAQAKRPFIHDRLVPFVTNMWDAYKGEILKFPRDLQDNLYQVYIDTQMANALVNSDLHKIGYGHGLGLEFYDKEYKEKCNEITDRAGKAIELLRSWLEQHGIKETIT